MKAITLREVQSYYNTMIGYIFTAICLLVGGVLFTSSNIQGGSASISGVIASMSYVLILIIPLLTMRLFAEEKKNKSDQLLLTAPVSVTQIVMGKFLAAVIVLLVTLVISLVFPIILVLFGDPYPPEIFLGYFGIVLLGCAFISIGLFISSLAENQLTAAVATMGILLLLWMLEGILPQISNPALNTVAGALSLYRQFETFQLGVLSLSAVVYFVSITFLFLFFTVRVIERRRWGKE
jgi:ABC-2 type transport system permease protein